MSCFSLAWIEQLLFWLVAVIVLVAIFKLLVPYLLGIFGGPPGGGVVFTILGYLLWGLVAVFCIVIAFDLLACIWPSGPSFRLGR
jgi:hypothetical protein